MVSRLEHATRLQWCRARTIWLSAVHIIGKNIPAVIDSRKFNKNVEWMLSHDIFRRKAVYQWGLPDIDMFISSLNKQVYASWKPDPAVVFVNAFSLNWWNDFILSV